MPCFNTVPISIIPPVSQGVAPILWQNGNQITRLNIPLNPSFLVYDGTITRWGDGSSTSPVYLPNIQEVNGPTLTYLAGITSTGQLVKTLGISGTALIGGAAGEVVYQTGPSATGFTAVGTTGQLLSSNGASTPTWLNQSSLSVGNATNAINATNATNATTAVNFSGSLSGDVTGTQLVTSVVKVNGASIPSSKTIVGTNGSGQIIDASASTATVALNTTGNATTSTSSSSAISGSILALTTAKAWVNFNGTGTIGQPQTIRSSYNVSSITKNGTGDYTVNFATAMADANYSVCVGAGNGVSGTVASTITTAGATPTTSGFRIGFGNNGFSYTDPVYAFAQVFGN